MARQSIHCTQCGDRMGSVDGEVAERALNLVRGWVAFLPRVLKEIVRQSMPVVLTAVLQEARAKCAKCSDAL
jgi:hypothetical protein